MHKSKIVDTIGGLSTIVSIVGIIFFFLNPLITLICAIFSLLNSFIQVVFGNQKNFAMEIFTIIISLIVCIFVDTPIIDIIAFSICIGDALLGVLGLIEILFIAKRF